MIDDDLSLSMRYTNDDVTLAILIRSGCPKVVEVDAEVDAAREVRGDVRVGDGGSVNGGRVGQ